MRESLELNRSMPFIQTLKTKDLAAERKGIKHKSWRMKIRLLLKRSSAAPKPRGKKCYRPTADDVEQWAQSLDKLLAHKYGKAAFCIFLKSEFCDENIDFWTACEDYKTITSKKELVSRANSMFEEFVKSEAPKEINLDFHTRNAIIEGLSEPDKTRFQAAQKKVYSLMENNSYPRFIYSDLYKDLRASAGGEGERPKH